MIDGLTPDCALDARELGGQTEKMDFGIGELLRHFEEHFGKATTKVLLAILGLAILGFAIRVVWETLIQPCYLGVLWLLSGHHFQYPSIDQIISSIVSWLIGLILYFLGMRILNRWTEGKIASIMEDAKQINKDVRKQVEEADAKLKADRLEFVELYLSVDVLLAVKKENDFRLKSGQEPITFPSLIMPQVLDKLLAIENKQTAIPSSSTPDKSASLP